MAQKKYGRAFTEQGHLGISLLHLQHIVNQTFADAVEHGLPLDGIRFKMRDESFGDEFGHPVRLTQIYWTALKEEEEG